MEQVATVVARGLLAGLALIGTPRLNPLFALQFGRFNFTLSGFTSDTIFVPDSVKSVLKTYLKSGLIHNLQSPRA